MPSYKVQITETLQYVEEVEADTADEALEMIENAYDLGEIILDADHFMGKEIEIIEEDV